MVRKLVFVQVAVGQGRVPVNALTRALDANPTVRQTARVEIPAGLAPACGLTLTEVRYDDLV
jgi:tRNA U38,U39,U40 pseudouridine synthase TruA